MTWRSVVVPRFGAPDVLRVDVGEVPRPGPGELRVRVLAAGVAPADVQMRAGQYPGRIPPPPFVPGWDVAGIVDAVGPDVSGQWTGQAVVALVLRGGHTSHVCMPSGSVVPLPEGTDVPTAACLPLNYLTAHELVHQVARVRRGERVLVDGAPGGVGTALLDVAGRAGARTVGAASGDDRAIVTGYGADFVDRTDVAAFDAGFDPVGAGRHAAALRKGGRLVTCGFLGVLRDPHPRRSAARQLAQLRLRSLRPDGRRAVFYRLGVAARCDPARLHRTLTTLVADLAAGQLRPPPSVRFPLDEAAEAHRHVTSRTRGKVLLLP
ncbi:alcohol dehydrogenase catalytic domain-containing protein [Actinophytocola algeriensis]|uniref:NADPH:quinone reductase-like Zn-dependent oxidoreductase n=1 Tax=Actinophytocola algeriensis TaxID=1768010 RepID=A0A7W7VHM4_9PSEU|nr:zinc-binding dehydrogenase [Actinophytocola algeriensis]MBB4910662.1 NADPH:quinone reductase-like Zn-dependent oxidoreductase [Actinophytocola algeriensis]MBE1473655.1 NADPH:quinone reductase-like Zn-dependent oxidoreductase [Actinophytocola algeriensis]